MLPSMLPSKLSYTDPSNHPSRVAFLVAGLVAVALVLGGCASSDESFVQDSATAHVGIYSQPPFGLVKARLGVPPFQAFEMGGNEDEVGKLAADQLTTLAFQSGRFDVIERAQLEQLLREQNLEGIVKAEELAKAGQVRGVDYLMYGRVTNLRVKSEKSSRGFGIGTIFSFFGIGGGVFDYKNKSEKIITECGVDLRMVDPTSGKVDAAHFGEIKRVDSIGAFGITVLGVGAEADASLEISEDDRGKLLRIVLDEAFRKMLDSIDKALAAR
ncbi:MAG: hypothetical protein JXP34_16160, partial [Planctomycetes bacterium]|nr:hypothetical protein [Planctomycetota bacterium]